MNLPEPVPYVKDHDNPDLSDECIEAVEKSFGKGICKPARICTKGISLKKLKKISE